MKRNLILSALLIYAGSLLQAHPPWGIIVDEQNNIYFADLNHNEMGSVWQLSSDGQLNLLLGNFHAHNVSLDTQNQLVSAHGEGDHLMIKLLKNGNIDTLIHKFNHDDFFGGNCTFTPQGKIIFSIGHYLWTILPNGKKQQVSEQYLEWNQALFVDQEGNIYAPDIGIENGALYKISPDGKADVLATNLISNLDRPRDKHNDVLLGMGKDEMGNLYICELAGKRIIQIDELGKSSTHYQSNGDWFPCAVYFKNDEMYILEYQYAKKGMDGPQIIKVNKNGKKSLLFNYENYHSKAQKSSSNKGKGRSNWWIYILAFIGLLLSFYRIYQNKK